MQRRFEWKAIGLYLLLLVATFGQTPRNSSGRQPEIGKLAGHWNGSGQIVVDWTTRRELPVNITISTGGVVRGTIGDAEITSARWVANRGPRVLVHSDFSILADLRGALFREDGIVRNRFRLNVTLRGGRLIGYGSSEGNASWPGASRESRLRSGRIQITRLVLEPSGTSRPGTPSGVL
jgi:hypothetical protein